MPKTRVQVKGRKNPGIRVKGKLGGRESMKSAFSMSNDDLIAFVNASNSRGRDRAKAIRVLTARGVTDYSSPTEE